jgi:Rrf2 family protein
MNFSKTTEYALRILSYMATGEKSLYSTKDIFEKLNIPFRYLRKQMTVLSKSGIISSVQGKQGGYKISKKLEEISFLDIIIAAGERPFQNECFFGFQKCVLHTKCAFHKKWAMMKESILNVLSTTSLADLKESGPLQFISNNNLMLTKNS